MPVEKESSIAAAVSEKPEKAAARSRDKSERSRKSGGGVGAFIAALSSKQKKAILMSAIAILLVIVIVISSVFGAKSCSGAVVTSGPAQLTPSIEIEGDKPTSDDPLGVNPGDTGIAEKDAYHYQYAQTTPVGFSGNIVGTVERVKPVGETKNEGDAFGVGTTGNIFANGAKRYPTYGSTLRSVIGSSEEQVAARGAIVSEASYLCAWGTRGSNRGGAQTADKYTRIDENGYLYQYKDGQWIHALVKKADDSYGPEYRRLYKHTAAEGMYREGATSNGVKYEISDDAEAVVKEIQLRPRGYSSYNVTGLYAPAGEVIKIELSGADMNATGGITVHIGQALYNGQANNIWVGKNQMQRFPHILITLVLNKSTTEYDSERDVYTGYVGSFVGGPIYVRNTSKACNVTISGGLEYLHFILGYTTEEEFNRIKATSRIPFFDLEVWTYGVLHSGPRYYAETFSYSDLYKAAVLWEKVSQVSTTKSNQGIVFIYDAFVAAGAAVAFPGRSSVNCPLGWMSASLNYNGLVTSGSWGNFHEYHHNFQGYGVGAGGEVTNNGMTLVSYALFTKISSKRGMGSFGAQGLGGWNNYTSATFAMEETLKIARPDVNPSNGNKGLALYATLLHNFGAHNYISAKVAGGGQSYAGYMGAWQRVTHNNMYYYFNDILCGTGITNNAPSEYPMFVPISCVYQTGRSYMYDGEKKYFKTMQPYVIANTPFDIDLTRYSAPSGQYASGSIVMPTGFTYRVKSVSKPANGTIGIVDEYNLKYTPAAGARTGSTSGQIIVTLEITKDDGAFKVDDVDLVLEFEITQEANKMTLSRTTYTYTEETMYTDAVQAFNSGFAGSSNGGLTQNHFNPTQNANTDIWFRPNTDKAHASYPKEPDKYFIHDNNIEVLDGKLYFDSDGTYRVYLRGRNNCALFYSHDGKNYKLGARINEWTAAAPSNKSHLFRPNAAETYFDVMFEQGQVYVKDGAATDFPRTPSYTIEPNEKGKIENWLYIKEVLLVKEAASSYIGVGMRQWDDPQFTQEIKYYRDAAHTDQVTTAQYNNMTDDERDDLYTETYYLNNAGQVVSEDDVINAQPTPPSVTEKNQPYVNAYRSDYNFPDNSGFESEYFYTRTYNYNYNSDPVEASTWDEGVKIVSCNKQPWAESSAIGNILVNGQDTFFHSGQNNDSSKGAMELVLDMGKKLTANKITFYGRSTDPATTAKQGLPKNFSLAVSNDGVTYTDAGTYSNSTGAAYSATVNLNAVYEFRYVKITITTTHSNNKHFILSGIKFTYSYSLTGNGANHISPDSNSIVFGGEWKAEQGNSTFGHYYHGTRGSTVNFEFSGTRLAVLGPAAYTSNFEVWIDGKKVDSEQVAKITGGFGVIYLTGQLENGKHKVEIKCNGDTYIDSFALY